MVSEKERILALIKEFGGTQQAFAKHIGVGQSAIANWIKRCNIPATAKSLILSKCDDISERWLLFGQGSMMLEGTNNFYKELEVSAGRIEFANHENERPQRIYIPGVEADAFFPVKGFSMYPTIQEGDIVGVVKVEDVCNIKPRHIYLVITVDNERMLKHVEFSPKSKNLTLTSDNPDYKPFKIKKESVLSIYKVIFHGRIPEEE